MGNLVPVWDLRPGEVIVVIFNSGVNSVPIDVSLAAQQKGLYVVAITSLAHTRGAASRHPSGKRLVDVADVMIDNCGVYGDAAVEVLGTEKWCGPTSTITGVLVVQLLTTAVIDELIKRGVEPPLYVSANRTEGDDTNEGLFELYRDRTRYS